MNNKILLLDLDGVVLKHSRIPAIVQDHVNNYVMKKLKVSSQEAKHINRLLYKNYGHTLLGLKCVYGIKDNIQDFTHSIYNKEFFSDMYETLARGDIDKEMIFRANEIKKILEHCNSYEIPYYLFTNAPCIWSDYILQMAELYDAFPPEKKLTCDHSLFTKHQLLKPDLDLYHNTEKYLKHIHSMDDPQFILIDDMFINLKPLIGCKNWQLFLNYTGPKISGPHIKSIYTPLQVIEYL